ncbi:MAG: hypothetical protein M3069_30930 [Chloroflexota bacterium]|nr:hypothetical protein [Chloroflexota bacterium]
MTLSLELPEVVCLEYRRSTGFLARHFYAVITVLPLARPLITAKFPLYFVPFSCSDLR